MSDHHFQWHERTDVWGSDKSITISVKCLSLPGAEGAQREKDEKKNRKQKSCLPQFGADASLDDLDSFEYSLVQAQLC